METCERGLVAIPGSGDHILCMWQLHIPGAEKPRRGCPETERQVPIVGDYLDRRLSLPPHRDTNVINPASGCIFNQLALERRSTYVLPSVNGLEGVVRPAAPLCPSTPFATLCPFLGIPLPADLAAINQLPASSSRQSPPVLPDRTSSRSLASP